MPEYFTGRGSDLGNVSKSPASNFSEVVNLHLAQPIPLALNKSRYDAMTKEEQDQAKRVAYLIAATFPTSPHRRKEMGDTGPCNLIFLDIDPLKARNPETGKHEYTGECPARPFVDDPDLLVRQLHKFNFAAYLTASHTAQKPRLRIVVDADRIPAARYAAAVNTVGKMLGLPVVTRESEIAVQAMFLPVMFADQGENDHPLLTYVLPSDERGTRPFTEADIIEGADTHFGKQYEQANKLPANPNALDYLRPPVDEVTLEIARDALSKIDPDLDRPDWLRVGMALKHQFSPHQEEEAFQLFDDWSRGELTGQPLFSASKYAGTDKTRSTWESFQPSPDNRVPVTVRTMLVKAVEGGWSSMLVKDQCFDKVLKWIRDGDHSFTQLTTDGIRRIAVMPLVTMSEEDALLRAIKDEVEKRFKGMGVTIPTLRKELTMVKRQIAESGEEDRKTKIPSWAKSLLFVSAHNVFFRHRTGEKFTPEALDNTYGAEMPLTDEFRPVVLPRNCLLNQWKCERVYDFEYNPAEPDNIITKDRGRLYVNTYVRTHPDPSPAQAGYAGSLFYGHLMNLIAEPQYRRLLCDWLAYLVQYPGRKILWAPLIQGAAGAGKTFIADCMRAVLGPQHVKTVDISAIKRGWNEWSNCAQLVVFEEIRVAGVNRHEIMNELKPLITNASININQRSKDSKEASNRTNYLLFTNYHDALALAPDDRRWFVVKSRLQCREHVLALGGSEYFRKLHDMLATTAAGLRAYLEGWNISDEFDPHSHAPMTTYLEQLVSDSASDAVAAVRKVIMDSDNPLVSHDLVSARNLMDMVRAEDYVTDISSQKIAHILRDEGYTNVCRPMLNGARHYLWAKGLDDMSEDAVAELARQRMEAWSASQNL